VDVVCDDGDAGRRTEPPALRSVLLISRLSMRRLVVDSACDTVAAPDGPLTAVAPNAANVDVDVGVAMGMLGAAAMKALGGSDAQ
jgi:hypothetical protein